MELPPALVIFDCDGVLVDSEPISAEVLIGSLGRHGLHLTRTDFMDIALGGTIPGIAVEAKRRGTDLPDTWVEDVYEEIFIALRDVQPIPGVVNLLDALDRAGVKVAVGSNGPHRKMHVTLGASGLARRFQGYIYSREDVDRPKPAPDLYLHAAVRAGVASDRSVVIEDSPTGAQAARAAGIYCLGYARDTEAGKLAPVCDRVFWDMRDLPRLLQIPAFQ